MAGPIAARNDDIAPCHEVPASRMSNEVSLMRTTKAALAAVPALLLALLGCGAVGLPSEAGDSDRQTGAEAEPAPADSASQPVQSEPVPSQPVPSPPSASVPPQEPVASQEFDLEGRRMSVAITQLRREGKTTTLNFTLTHEDGPAWRIGNDMGDSVTDYTLGGVSLVDTGNAKRYRPGRTGANKCLCSETSGGRPIEEGKGYPFYAMFAAPPPEVTKVHIEIPQFGIMANVPIS
ncbi:hypothetical protein AB0I81_63210 [Nonomuraea sp. NPDC050404]|uniref:hypothetical protein n=1 Tax=Nonomuraea sp. NPDC050404 TaxID=3155783 RepID=UPI0033EBD744